MSGNRVSITLCRRGVAIDGGWQYENIPVEVMELSCVERVERKNTFGVVLERVFLFHPGTAPRLTDRLRAGSVMLDIAEIRECRDAAGTLRAYRVRTA